MMMTPIDAHGDDDDAAAADDDDEDVLVHDITRWINVRKFIWLRQVRPHPCLYRHLILRKVFAFGFSSNIILCHLCLPVCLSDSLSLYLWL